MPPRSRAPFRRFDRERPKPEPRKRMLSQGRKAHFVYDMRDLLSRTGLEEKDHRAFVEMLFARGSRASTEDAKMYVNEKVEDQTFTRDQGRAIKELVDRYSHWR